jgi:hypothetical protein
LKTFLLRRNELMFLLRVVGVRAVVGLPKALLDSVRGGAETEQLEEGRVLLEGRGLLREGAGRRQELDETLDALVGTITNPRRAILISRETVGAPRQIVILYEQEQSIAEQTFPAPGVHRLNSFATSSDMFERVRAVLDLCECPAMEARGELPVVTFLNLLKLNAAGQHEEVSQLLGAHSGMTREGAELFVKVLKQPVSANVVAFLKCAGTDITDARELTILQGVTSLWAIHQREPGLPKMTMTTTTPDEITELVQRLFREVG